MENAKGKESVNGFDLQPLFIKITAEDTRSWKTIDRLYEENKPESQINAAKRLHYGDKFMCNLSPEALLRAKKLAGISELKLSAISDLLNKLFHKEIRYLETQPEPIPFKPYMQHFCTTYSISDLERHFVFYCAFCQLTGKQPDEKEESYIDMMNRYLFFAKSKAVRPQLTPEENAKAKEIRKAVPLSFHTLNDISVSDLMDEYQVSFESVTMTEGIYFSAFENYNFSNRELKELLDIYVASTKDASPEEFEDYYVMSMILKSLARHAKEAKDAYIKSALDLDVKSSIDYKSEYLKADAERSSLRKLNETKQESLNEINLSYDKLKLAYDEIKRQQASLQEENDILLKMLDAQESETPETEENYDISKAKIVVIGGHENWQNKVAALGKNITIIKGSDADFDVNLLKSAEVVVVNWTYFSHKQFFRLKTACAKEKLVYIGNNNINYFVSAVGRHLKE